MNVMYLIEGSRKRIICREYRALHSPQNCPRLIRERKRYKRFVADLQAITEEQRRKVAEYEQRRMG